eukprot:TRINITY_DN3294_c0_g1_i2.p1 TRINITY_DN3294_c0_g1~~TRINITY_DN3294_c0_g1_i2.p1  ORF type:complete len:317 (-),score=84.53 TRINITY_DN3294_c0_g1_i2:138-1088(-)
MSQPSQGSGIRESRAPPLEPLVKGSISLRSKGGEYTKVWLIQKDLSFGSDPILCTFQFKLPGVLPRHVTLQVRSDGFYIIDHSIKVEEDAEETDSSFANTSIYCNGTIVTQKETLLTTESVSSSLLDGEEETELYHYLSFCGKVFRISYFGNDHRRANRAVLMIPRTKTQVEASKTNKVLPPPLTNKRENIERVEKPQTNKIMENQVEQIMNLKNNAKCEIVKLSEEIRIEQNLKAKLQMEYENRGKQILQLKTEKKNMVELINSLVCSACSKSVRHTCCLPSSKISQLSALDLLKNAPSIPTKKKVPSPKKKEPL